MALDPFDEIFQKEFKAGALGPAPQAHHWNFSGQLRAGLEMGSPQVGGKSRLTPAGLERMAQQGYGRV